MAFLNSHVRISDALCSAGEKEDSVRARCEAVCERLCVEAVKRGCSDNVTVMLILLEHPKEAEK